MRQGRNRSLALIALGGMLAVGGSALAQEYPPTEEEGTLNVSVVAAGGTITFSGGGFEPGSDIEIWLTCPPEPPRHLATISADASGDFSTDVTIPDDIPPGECTLEARGIGPDGAPHTVTAEFTVTEPTVPPTGVAVPTWLALGLILTSAVVGIVVIKSRGRPRERIELGT